MSRQTEEQPLVSDDDVEALRKWAADIGPGARAAVELLIADGHWLDHEEFVGRCVKRHGELVFVDFSEMRMLWRNGTYGSNGQMGLLLVIADIGSNHWPLAVMDARAVDRTLFALASAAGKAHLHGDPDSPL